MALQLSAPPRLEERHAAWLHGGKAPTDLVVLDLAQGPLPPAASPSPVSRRWSFDSRRLEEWGWVTLRGSALPELADRIATRQHGAAVARKLVPRSPLLPLSLGAVLSLPVVRRRSKDRSH